VLKRVLGLSICLVLASDVAMASEPDEATMMAAQDAVVVGRAHFKAGRWLDGIEAYEKAYALFPQIEHLMTIAAAFEKVPSACTRAVGAWERYLRVCDLCDGREKALLRLENLKMNCRADAEPPSPPDPKLKSRAAIDEAEAHRRDGRHLEAVAAYEQAYGLTEDPVHLYEAARAYAAVSGYCTERAAAWSRFLAVCQGCELRAAGEAGKRAAEKACASAVGGSADPGGHIGGQAPPLGRFGVLLGGGLSLAVEGNEPARETSGQGVSFSGGVGWSRRIKTRLEMSIETVVHVDVQALTHASPSEKSSLFLFSLNVPLLLRQTVWSTPTMEVQFGLGLEPRISLAAVSDTFSSLDPSVITLRLPLSLQFLFDSAAGGYRIELRGDQQLTALFPTYAFRSVSLLLGVRL